MPNLTRKLTGSYSTNALKNDIEEALKIPPGQAITPVVGVMIQYGKTLTNPANYRFTTGGGHVSTFVVDEYGHLKCWDEVTQSSWQHTIQNSRNIMDHIHDNDLFRLSNHNDVTVYLHPATTNQVDKVRARAELLLNATSLNYNHWPSFNKPVKNGDCVTRSAWVMGAFSYILPMRGALTPWGKAAICDAYTMKMNGKMNGKTKGWKTNGSKCILFGQIFLMCILSVRIF